MNLRETNIPVNSVNQVSLGAFEHLSVAFGVVQEAEGPDCYLLKPSADQVTLWDALEASPINDTGRPVATYDLNSESGQIIMRALDQASENPNSNYFISAGIMLGKASAQHTAELSLEKLAELPVPETSYSKMLEEQTGQFKPFRSRHEIFMYNALGKIKSAAQIRIRPGGILAR